MPADLEKKENAVYEMRHEFKIDQSIHAFDATECNNLILELTTELNNKFMTELGYASVTEQSAVTDEPDDDSPFHRGGRGGGGGALRGNHRGRGGQRNRPY
jgi:hypothetical protein